MSDSPCATDELPSRMQLSMFYTPIGSRAAWRRAESGAEHLYRLDAPLEAAVHAEEAKLDAILYADVLEHIGDAANPDVNGYEPVTLMAAIAARTTKIGVVATVSTTFSEPYTVARQFSGVDHLSGGRAGWNVVTSRVGAKNHSMTMPARAERYQRADEFLEVTTKLWDAWQPDAVVCNKQAGVWADDSRIQPIHHHGEYFDVEGPMIVPRSPQGRPVLFQAGQSEEGREFAAKWADVVFTAQIDVNSAIDFRNDVRSRARRYGRDSDQIKVLPGISFIFGETTEAAEAVEAELLRLENMESAIHRLAAELGGIDLSGLDVTDAIPSVRLLDPELVSQMDGKDAALFYEGSTSRYLNLYDSASAGSPISHLLRRLGGHHVVVGTPKDAADEMEHWFRAGACDGFIVPSRYMPEGLEIFLDHVIPLLQERGLAQTEYGPGTLNDRLSD